jgi:hypothetical protein
MTFTQQTFLGSSISKFSASIGWGRTLSNLEVTLADDTSNGDSFSPGFVGRPVYFNYSGWVFGGLLQSWVRRKGEQENEVFYVTVTDPREILDGVQLVLDNYSGGIFGTVNLYNVYGYMEARFGFGGAQSNDSGMPWYLIKQGFEQLQLSTVVRLRDYAFKVDLSRLPRLPNSYRISGESLTLMDFIEEVCEAGACDYFVELQLVNGVNWIVVRTISRNNPSQLGKINSFINSVFSNYSEAGVELNNTITSKFLVGGNQEALHYVEQNPNCHTDTFGEDNSIVNLRETTDANGDGNDWFDDIDYERRTVDGGGFYERGYLHEFDDNNYVNFDVWPYWGYYFSDKSLIVGRGNPQRNYWYNAPHEASNSATLPYPTLLRTHRFTIDISPLRLTKVNNRYKEFYNHPETGLPLGTPYITDTMELKSVLAGQESWELFLHTYNYNRESIHYKKANRLKLKDRLGVTKVKKAVRDDRPLRIDNLITDAEGEYEELDKEMEEGGDTLEVELKRLYDFLAAYANNYMGKKFMVKVDGVSLKVEDGTGNFVTNLDPIQAAYVDEITAASGSAPSVLPYDIEKLQDENNKIFGYVRFDNFARDYIDEKGSPTGTGRLAYDISELDPNDYTVWDNKLYVKCEVDPEFVYWPNKINPQDARAVVTLPASIKYKPKKFINRGFFYYTLRNAGYSKVDTLKRLRRLGVSSLYEPEEGFMMIPDVAAIPLKSNVLTYGPWYTQGNNGKTEFEQDDTLVPWNYGGYTQLNIVANGRLQNISSAQQAGETGTVTFAGVPGIQLGYTLITGGPYVTNVNVSIGEEGATTTYRMKTWTKDFVVNGKVNEDRIKKLYEIQRKRQKETRELFKNKYKLNNKRLIFGESVIRAARTAEVARRHRPRTPMPFLASSLVSESGIDEKGSEVYIVTHDDVYGTVYDDYTKKAISSLDTVFRPFCTASGSFEGPCFVDPSPSAVSPTVEDLNPFTAPHDFSVSTRGDEVPDGGLTFEDGGDEDDVLRLTGIRAPMILSGWGYDTSGKPVPNADPEDPGDEFVDDYKRRMDLWKAGPVDLRWDERRGVWGVSNIVQVGQISDGDTVENNTTYEVTLKNKDGVTSNTINAKNITGVTLSGVLQVRLDYFEGYDEPLMSPYEWTTC